MGCCCRVSSRLRDRHVGGWRFPQVYARLLAKRPGIRRAAPRPSSTGGCVRAWELRLGAACAELRAGRQDLVRGRERGPETGLCEQQAPCNLQDLVREFSTVIASGDTVQLAGNVGTYGTAGAPLELTIVVPQGVMFTRTLASRCRGSTPTPPPLNRPPKLEGPNAVLSDVDLEYTGVGGFSAVFGEGKLERVSSRVPPPAGSAAFSLWGRSSTPCAPAHTASTTTPQQDTSRTKSRSVIPRSTAPAHLVSIWRQGPNSASC